jgi:hypothetical protein
LHNEVLLVRMAGRSVLSHSTAGIDRNHVQQCTGELLLPRESISLVFMEHAKGIQNVYAHLRDQHTVASKETRAIVAYYYCWVGVNCKFTLL